MKRIKWNRVFLVILLIVCLCFIVKDLYMLSIYSLISGNLYGWSWFGFITFLLAIITTNEIIEYLKNGIKKDL